MFQRWRIAPLNLNWLKDARKHKVILAIIGMAAFVYLVLRIAWVSDDGYITFRTLEQIMAGHGLRWNPHERVQAFTSPLWLFVLLVPRLFSANVFLNAIGAAVVMDVFLLVVLWYWVQRDGIAYFGALVLLVASKGFFDYTTSGLESPLAYALLALFALWVQRWANAPKPQRPRLAFEVWVVGGLVVFTRYDLVLMVLPALVWVWWKSYSLKSWGLHLRRWMTSLAPVLMWAAFALFYYGTPFPNTAYAKMPPGYPRWVLLKDGIKYFIALGKWDIASLILLGGGLGLAFWAGWLMWRSPSMRKENETAVSVLLGMGMVLHLAYVLWVGGDFMLGRFVAFDTLWAVMLIAWWVSQIEPPWIWATLILVGLIYLQWYPDTAVNAPLLYTNPRMWKGIADERGFFEEASLFMYLHGHYASSHRPFPPTGWTKAGIQFREGPHTVTVAANIGYFGYWAGTDKIIVDRYALADPLLSRLPAKCPSRIGHFQRPIPEGYLATLETGNLQIQDPALRAYYQHLALVTQGPLWSWARFRAILCLNLGCYRHYLQTWEAHHAP